MVVGRTGLALALVALMAFGGSALAPAEPSQFAATQGAGVSFDGAYALNGFLLEDERPFGVKVSNGAEPSILVSRDGTTIWVGDTSGLWRSTNNGNTWTRSPNPFLPGVFGDGWALAEDEAGRLYASTTQGQASGVAVSTNKGASWLVTSSPAVSVSVISDRPWLAARGDGEVSLVTNNVHVTGSETCYRSTDAGLTWTSTSVTNGQANAGNLVYDRQGDLWYSNGASLYEWRRPCLSGPAPSALPPSGPAIFTPIDLDENDRAYFANPSMDSRQMILYAPIPGNQFRQLVVSAPALQSNSFPAISVLNSGEIAVAWYGSETAGNPSVNTFAGSWNVYVARVQGFWTANPTITTTRVTTEPNHVGDFCMGGVGCTTGSGDRDLLDYFMIDLDQARRIHVAYGHDGAGSASEVRYARVDP